MRQVKVDIRGLSPYSQSRQHDTPKLDGEDANAYDQRTWRERMTIDTAGLVHIPAMSFKWALVAASRKLGLQIPGRGKSTYTKYFEADVICSADVPLGIHKDVVPSITLFVNADGVRGGGKRVPRTFPVIHEWRCAPEFVILDDTITVAVFERVLRAAGMGIGIGRFRPENGGINGRFEPVSFQWAAQ